MPDATGHTAPCEFVRGDGPPTCTRPTEPVEMGDGGVVHVCGYHRGWVVALARVEADRA